MPKVTLSTSASSTTTPYDDYIKHYRIKKHENGSLYISKHLMFPSLIELIDYYKSNQGGLVCPLRSACPRELLNVPLKDLEVQQDQIQLIDHLGSGQFGDVYRALINGKQEVAVKTLKTESTMEVGKFRKEAEIMHNLRHPRLVGLLLGICMQSRPLFIITEFMCGGSLTSYLQDNRTTLNFNNLVDIAAQVADGMSYLESQNPPYIHRDLRAANVLVAGNNVVKVADFGLAKQVEEGVYEGSEVSRFPVKWTAPEGLRFMLFTVKSDVWSYGVLLYEIFTLGKVPYSGWSNFEVKTQVLQGYRLPQPSTGHGALDEQVYDVMVKCWNEVDVERPSFAQLLIFFDEIILESNYFVSDLD
ncbi:hypothetical protein HELRODRAFT_69263 [Helobdella robusta]|uniref:non-specific protein-tyrosine kinase n=1 Tax=Helobdella robusta TaxID=6412 RepID=T1FZS1_HELRO|nr:hypothetical protein HELRODRAFT_69263 [Helobdella robusta]ESN93057.1 hypothetical protein HELRODRAFT_69263 [Helobdella robusta]